VLRLATLKTILRRGKKKKKKNNNNNNKPQQKSNHRLQQVASYQPRDCLQGRNTNILFLVQQKV
jgi:hypothetical protein